ncbi:MAG: ROK family protein [Verrucomicrobia bacterium]|nr:ROK family protein [Verrucomicrobiota bacterium]
MNTNNGLPLIPPRIVPVLDLNFRPAVLANRAFRQEVRTSGNVFPLTIALEQADGSTFHFSTEIFAEGHPKAVGNFIYVERIVKFLLWAWGGYRVYLNGPASLGDKLKAHFAETPTGKFDADIMGNRIYERPFEIVVTDLIPSARAATAPLGRHLDGCRIGFDLGGSDRKTAAVIDGKVVFSEEVVWDPYMQPDPDYHLAGIMDSLQKAAEHLPRVDAIGGSAAGVYVNNRVKVASLFRGVSKEDFKKRVKDMFLEVKTKWNNVPFEIVNDGEVTALAGSMSLNRNAVLGIAMGTSQAGGYVTPEGNITTWLNELAFMPVDYNPNAARDEWSGDYGCGVQYFSQQAVAKLIPASGLEVDSNLGFPEKLKAVQSFMENNDERAAKIYQTIGTYLGYAVAHYADFYDLENVLILGRVTSGKGGDIILDGAKEVLKAEFPELAQKITFHVPDEKDKRHGQAIAAASLPKIDQEIREVA